MMKLRGMGYYSHSPLPIVMLKQCVPTHQIALQLTLILVTSRSIVVVPLIFSNYYGVGVRHSTKPDEKEKKIKIDLPLSCPLFSCFSLTTKTKSIER